LEKQLETEQRKLQEFYTEVMTKAQRGELDDQAQKSAEGTLMKMQADLQKLASEADEALAKKEQELTKPIYDEFERALGSVAREHGFAYILDKKLLLYSAGSRQRISRPQARTARRVASASRS